MIPGVSAAQAAAAAAGAPLTMRGLAQAVTFVAGHAADGAPAPDLDWRALARPNQTLAVYMGVARAREIAAQLMLAGRSPATPALVVENASRSDERRVVATLAGLAEAVDGMRGPALLMVGETAALAQASAPADPVHERREARA